MLCYVFSLSFIHSFPPSPSLLLSCFGLVPFETTLSAVEKERSAEERNKFEKFSVRIMLSILCRTYFRLNLRWHKTFPVLLITIKAKSHRKAVGRERNKPITYICFTQTQFIRLFLECARALVAIFSILFLLLLMHETITREEDAALAATELCQKVAEKFKFLVCVSIKVDKGVVSMLRSWKHLRKSGKL